MKKDIETEAANGAKLMAEAGHKVAQEAMDLMRAKLAGDDSLNNHRKFGAGCLAIVCLYASLLRNVAELGEEDLTGLVLGLHETDVEPALAVVQGSLETKN